jgi:hypothetical protein
MKLSSSKNFPMLARWLGVLLVAWLLPASAFAQADAPARWLFVFETSPAMQKRLPATEAALKNFFAIAAATQLQTGDSIGVWTCGQNLRTGEFPLTTWQPGQAATLTSNLLDFLHAQKTSRGANLAALQPLLDGVVADSAQFTAVIFCDGDSEINGTPYDTGVNQTLRNGRAERKKNAQPFVVVLRSLGGKYLGCTVNFPPGMVSLPPFPPPPPVTNPPPRVVAVVKPAPAPVAPSLVIVGTNVSGPLAEPPAAAPAEKFAPPAPVETPKVVPAPISPPPATVPVVPVKPVVIQAAAPVAVKLVATNPPPAIAAPVATENTDHQTRHLLYAGVGLFVVVIIVGVLVVRSRRQPQSSLITSSMQDDPRRK